MKTRRLNRACHGTILNTVPAEQRQPRPFVYWGSPPAKPLPLPAPAPQRMKLGDYLAHAPASERRLIAKLRGV